MDSFIKIMIVSTVLAMTTIVVAALNGITITPEWALPISIACAGYSLFATLRLKAYQESR